MAKILSAKCKQCRREGEKLFLKGDRCYTPNCGIVKKPYAPGLHGKKFKRVSSEFGLQLREKQKVKRIYGILERQFKKHFDEAKKKKGVLGELVLFRLEKRLDNVIYRLGIAKSRSSAKQIVGHGHILVERAGKKRRVDIPSFEVRIGDKIFIKESSKKKGDLPRLESALKNYSCPPWLSIDKTALVGEVIAEPTMDDVNINAEVQLIVEHYSR